MGVKKSVSQNLTSERGKGDAYTCTLGGRGIMLRRERFLPVKGATEKAGGEMQHFGKQEKNRR